MLIKNLLVFLVTAVLIFVGAEIYYRFLNPEVLGNTGSLSYTRWAKNNIKINSWGFRDIERSAKKSDPSIHRVLVIGPSNIFGQGISNLEERLSERLEKALNANGSGTRFEVINCGTMTLDPISTGIQIINGFIKAGIEFDSVVFYYSWNNIKHIGDIAQRYMEHKQKHASANQANSIAKMLAQNSYAYDWLSNVANDKGFLIEGKTYNDWHIGFYYQDAYYQEHLRVLQSIDQFLKQNGKSFYLLVTPVSYKEEERTKYQDLVVKFLNSLKESGISYADATNIYKGIPEMEIPVSKYDGHNKSKFYGDMVNLLLPVMQ